MEEPVVPLPGWLLLPGGVNAHNHSFQSPLRGLGDDLDFMGWRDRVLYPFSRQLDAEGIEIGAALSSQAITDVWVRGRRVVRDGRLTTLEETALLADVRALTRDWGGVAP